MGWSISKNKKEFEDAQNIFIDTSSNSQVGTFNYSLRIASLDTLLF